MKLRKSLLISSLLLTLNASCRNVQTPESRLNTKDARPTNTSGTFSQNENSKSDHEADRFFSNAPKQPGQSRSGPGGSDYLHGGATVRTVAVSTSFGEMDYTIYEPSEPRPPSAPVVVFLMGNGVYQPSSISHLLYSALYLHLARKGYLVVHPDNSYRESTRLPPGTAADDVDNILAELIKAALNNQEQRDVRPARDKEGIQFAIGGHSAGGLLAQMLANQNSDFSLPVARALLLMDPTPPIWPESANFESGANATFIGMMNIPPHFENISSSSHVLVIRTNDSLGEDYGLSEPLPYMIPNLIWEDAEGKSRMINLPNENYSYAYLRSDNHGQPTIESAHLTGLGTSSETLNSFINLLAPLIPKEVAHNAFLIDAADFAIWRKFEAMLNYCFKADAAAYRVAFDVGDGSAFRSMGTWSDGVPVRELLSQNDFPALFDVTPSLFPARPNAPNGLLVSGAPKILFMGGVMIPISAHVTSYGPTPVKVLTARITGPNASHFSLDSSLLEGTVLNTQESIHFGIDTDPNLKSDIAIQATLEITYEMDGSTFVILRTLERIAGLF